MELLILMQARSMFYLFDSSREVIEADSLISLDRFPEIAPSLIHLLLEAFLDCFRMLSERSFTQVLSLSGGMEWGSPALDSAMTELDLYLEEMTVLQVAWDW